MAFFACWKDRYTFGFPYTKHAQPMKMARYLSCSLFLLSLLACNSTGADPSGPAASGAQMPVGDNSRNALDWNGTYQGIVPCGDCAGIQTKITLMKDGRFRRSLTYLGKEDHPRTDTGSFRWNQAGSAVILKALDGSIQMYLVGEYALFQLDQSGKRITGELSDRYKLEKNYADQRLEDRRWVLVELQGQPFKPHDEARETYVEFQNVPARISGFGVCNQFNGAYDIMPGEGLSISSNLIATMMVCPDSEQESTFFDVLKAADRYVVTDTTLTLHQGDGTPLARFRYGQQ